MNSRPVLLMTFVALFAMAAIGFVQLTDYSSRPGKSGQAPLRVTDVRLSDTSLADAFPAPGVPTLLVFYHPKCPCTVATVRVLERLQPRFRPKLRITAVAYCPGDQQDTWIESRTTTALSKLASSQVVVDRGGKLCKRFGVFVSGQVLLYDGEGRLSFSGGITPYRGHEGDSPSSLDLLKRINTSHDDCGSWPVFGCSMLSDSERQR
ncbi:TlpA family protein disulfide reductase [Rhodopirellula sp. JC639]|uniref:TlpA family protein disulfide reductase n=1 Tax=Stieleria mannarensis TaxID=2755585 RepID=UPI001C7227F7|nr:RedB [Rhodopirellula sp. JC639]